MWVGLIQSVEGLIRAKALISPKQVGPLPAHGLQMWTATPLLPGAPAHPCSADLSCVSLHNPGSPALKINLCLRILPIGSFLWRPRIQELLDKPVISPPKFR